MTLTRGCMEPGGCQLFRSNSPWPIPFAPLPISAMASQEFLPGQKEGEEGGTKGQCGGDAEQPLSTSWGLAFTPLDGPGSQSHKPTAMRVV